MQIKPPLQDNKDYNYFTSICKQNNIDFRIVGGCSRDLILGKKPTDIDIAIKCRINSFIKILDKNNIKYNSFAIKYASILIKFKSCNIEVTSLRIDFEQTGRKTKIAYTSSWKKDSLRRDFTINAIYIDCYGQVYDFHNGIKHLKEQKIQFIGNAEEKIHQDYLRILRYYRFKGYFKSPVVDKFNEDLINNNFEKMTLNLNNEIITKEILKMYKMTYYRNCFFVINEKIELPWVEYIKKYWNKTGNKTNLKKCFEKIRIK